MYYLYNNDILTVIIITKKSIFRVEFFYDFIYFFMNI